MKTCTVFVASAVLAVVSIDSAMGMASYLKELPNGESFAKALGHKDSGYTDFGNAFSKAGAKWSADFCKQTFPGTSMTNGAAFGDPCCTWKVGGKPDFTVTAFTDKPTQETKCASAAAPSTAPAASSAAPTPAAPTDAPATTAPAPATTPAPAPSGDAAAATTAPATTPAPGAKPVGKKPVFRPAKCGVKKDKKKGSKKESKSLEDGSDDSDEGSDDDN